MISRMAAAAVLWAVTLSAAGAQQPSKSTEFQKASEPVAYARGISVAFYKTTDAGQGAAGSLGPFEKIAVLEESRDAGRNGWYKIDRDGGIWYVSKRETLDYLEFAEMQRGQAARKRIAELLAKPIPAKHPLAPYLGFYTYSSGGLYGADAKCSKPLDESSYAQELWGKGAFLLWTDGSDVVRVPLAAQQPIRYRVELLQKLSHPKYGEIQVARLTTPGLPDVFTDKSFRIVGFAAKGQLLHDIDLDKLSFYPHPSIRCQSLADAKEAIDGFFRKRMSFFSNTP